MNLFKSISKILSKFKIQTQLIVIVALGSLLISTFFYLYISQRQNNLFHEYFKKNTSSVSETIKIAIELGASSENYNALVPIFTKAIQDSSVKLIVVLDENNELVGIFPQNLEPNIKELLQKAKSSSAEDTTYYKSIEWKTKYGNGNAIIGFSTEQLSNLKRESLQNLTLSLLVILALSISLFSGIALSITKPLNKLISVAVDISKGNETIRANNLTGNIELRTLANSFNVMLDRMLETQAIRIDEVKKFNESLENQNNKLIELHKEKNEFLGIVAHDLKNPLSSIMLNAEMISNYYDRMQKKEILDYISKIGLVGKSMTYLIRDLLDINAIESGNINIDFQKVDFSKLVNDISAQYALITSNKNINLINEIEKDIQIYADSQRLVQITDNLISNSIKFSPKNKSIFIRCYVKDENVIFEVEDQGPGIKPEEMMMLFKKFTKLSARPTANESSTGLGLSIAKKLTDAMNGEIWCESELGKGAKFCLKFKTI